jgi:hypothetical protein
MSRTKANVSIVTGVRVPDPLPPAITRPREHVEAVLAQSLIETGQNGRAALAWAWALTGTRPSPVTLTLASGRSPTRQEIEAEAQADPEGSAAPPGVPSDYCDQLGEARRILAWLTGASDEIPLDDEQRGRFIGARDDYARTDAEIRQVRDRAARSPAAFDLPELIDPADAANPWRWPPAWINAAWQRGVRDLLGWILGERPASPLCRRVVVGLPTVYDLSYEESAASDVPAQGHPAARQSTPPATRHPTTAKPSKPPSPGSAASPPACLPTRTNRVLGWQVARVRSWPKAQAAATTMISTRPAQPWPQC